MKITKQKLYDLTEMTYDANSKKEIYDFFDIFIICLIILNVIAVILETEKELHDAYRFYFYVFDRFSLYVFSLEYITRLWVCTVDPKYSHPLWGRLKFAITPLLLVDLIAILPFYLPMIFPDLRFIRSIRLFRLFRAFKFARYSKTLQTFANVIKAKKMELITAMTMVFFLLILSSSVMYYVEHEAQPKAFSSILSSMWWGIATLTTVGYGDMYPITPLGKFIGSIIALLGIGMVALPAGILASGFSNEIMEQKEKNDPGTFCPHCGKKLNNR
jgi:voltage-gated potassium channel